nr:tetratricopeptide repeat protein [Pleurocapsa sp. MO_192.B19]
MSVITIREQQQTDTGFEATVAFDGRTEYPVTISEPFTPKQEKELEWYFEEWLVYPMLEDVKAKRAAASVKKYGEELFDRVFGDRKAYREYDKLKSNLSQLQIEIISKTPEFQALHWEALRDPELPRPLAVDCIMLRKTVSPTAVPAKVKESPVINLLVVTARPDEDSDVGYRTISRPLVELIDNSQLRVNVELLRPATYEALCKHLEEKGEGYYHIIHFDTHGALLTYEQIQQGVKTNRYLYQRGYGLEDIEAYSGVKAFLIFEGKTKGKATPVEASELANLLTGKRIPVCILNACQSGKQIKGQGEEGKTQEDTRETSLGSRLMAAGMQMVVAMGYSVTVSAAELMMQQLYQHLFDEKEITTAIRLGRKELFNDKERQAYFNYKIDLEDWLLPVTYYNRQVDLNLRDFTPEEEENYWESVGSQYRFPSPEYGFIGRDLEILKIEKALLGHNVLLLRGMGGTGKTTLLNYLREWWQRTNFAVDVFYFGYDEKAWTLEQILYDIGKQVYSRFEQAKFQAMNQTAQVQKLAKTLRTQSYVLMLDNLESVTGQQLAIQNTLPESEQNKIRDFLTRLVGGKTKVVFGSRSGEEWLQNTFKNNVYQLQGLDPESRSILAEKILERHIATNQIENIRQDENFQRLMKLLAGYPLAMEVVLANLKTQKPEEILSRLQASDIDLDTGSEDKTKSIIQCVEYSHSNLSPETQKLLLCLAPFSGIFNRQHIAHYSQELQNLESFKDYSFEQFDRAIQEAINWGLLLPDENDPELLTIQPVFPYFLNNKLKENDSISEGLREAFKNHYKWLANDYQQLMKSEDSQHQQVGIFLCHLEYENLYQALQINLKKQESVYTIWNCLYIYFDLTNNRPDQLQLTQHVYDTLSAYTPEKRTQEWGQDIISISGDLGICYERNREYETAENIYLDTLTLIDNSQNIEESQKQSYFSSGYNNLGDVAGYLRKWNKAQEYYQRTLEIKIQNNYRYSCAGTYYNLGLVAFNLRQYEQAQEYYQQALNISIEDNDRYKQASIYHQLGIIAQELKEYQQARRYYQQALNISIEDNDRYNQAKIYHSLGVLAAELKEYQQARRYYQQALQIRIEDNDRYKQAGTYHQLGMVAQEMREYQQARRYYQQALDL